MSHQSSQGSTYSGASQPSVPGTRTNYWPVGSNKWLEVQISNKDHEIPFYERKRDSRGDASGRDYYQRHIDQLKETRTGYQTELDQSDRSEQNRSSVNSVVSVECNVLAESNADDKNR